MNNQRMLQYAPLSPDHNEDTTVQYINEEIVYFLLSCLFQTVWFLLPNLEDFDLSELLD